ncbi:DUF1697 domain-containing protein [Paenibacillus montanisoli]|uniref:Cytoplasmic protein n=1 Tax=Paenibacillus montanisoli TaxID=2081970 RepID=A0A328U5E0_9BACL|nr:DUF1697 domain-containing protein [Paenibacillus montanisoli]RAP77779.1 cytoplasmic protein [Paenibacillus montanisoli]
MAIHIALLRGINVGGKNKIKMADLREALGTIGLTRVQTYIQSGNILFESEEREPALRERIEGLIERQFGLSIKVVMRTAEEMAAIAAGCPFSDEQIAAAEASSEGECLYVSMLLEAPPTERVEKLQGYAAADERFVVSGRDIYLLFGQSIRNSKLAVQVDKLNVPSTVRNWNTVNKLLAMAQEMSLSRT